MYIRPQLSRKRTENREILSKEHASDVLLYEKTLEKGRQFGGDSDRILKLKEEISRNDTLSENDKKAILEGLNSALDELEKEYDREIQNLQKDIEYSLKERIDEMETAVQKREYELFEAERTLWETDAVDKDKLVSSAWKLHQQYDTMIEHAKSDLHELTKEAMEQRRKMLERKDRRE